MSYKAAPPPIAQLAELAVAALVDEAMLQPKPGLVDPRGGGAHTDMQLGTLLASADALRPVYAELAALAAGRPADLTLRAEVGVAGRRGEARMLAATGGINTHRGALWAVGLLVCGAANASGLDEVVDYGAELARLPDLSARSSRDTHGEGVRRRYGAGGARHQAQTGFPAVRRALDVIDDVRGVGRPLDEARLTALVVLVAEVEDTCLLHRGGLAGLRDMQRAARRVLDRETDRAVHERAAFHDLDRLAARRGLSPGGSGDLLGAALFLHDLMALNAGAPERVPAPPHGPDVLEVP